MIIIKTPLRVSFFGGGTDFPEWYKKNKGLVVTTTIDYYIYLTIKDLPNFFLNTLFKISYSKIENVSRISEIKHKVFKKYFEFINLKKPLEIHVLSDLPAKSGLGSSGSFIVSLINAFSFVFKKKISKKQLAKKSIFFEQKILKEACGSQDQIISSYGGLKKIFFKNNSFEVKKIKISKKKKITLQNSLVLFFTGFSRSASTVEKKKIKNIDVNKDVYKKLYLLAKKGLNILEDNTSNLDEFGYLLNEAWKIKKKTSSNVSNNKIDEIYEKGIKNGALGGKLLGAGNGGFLLFYVKSKNKKKLISAMRNYLYVPFKFSDKGSEIIKNI